VDFEHRQALQSQAPGQHPVGHAPAAASPPAGRCPSRPSPPSPAALSRYRCTSAEGSVYGKKLGTTFTFGKPIFAIERPSACRPGVARLASGIDDDPVDLVEDRQVLVVDRLAAEDRADHEVLARAGSLCVAGQGPASSRPSCASAAPACGPCSRLPAVLPAGRARVAAGLRASPARGRSTSSSSGKRRQWSGRPT
jgi:hypothetical protein